MAFQPGNTEHQKADRRKPKIIAQNLIAELQDAEGAKLRRVVKALIAKAEEGDVPAIKEILDRVDGKVPQAHGGDEEAGPIKMLIGWMTEQNEGS